MFWLSFAKKRFERGINFSLSFASEILAAFAALFELAADEVEACKGAVVKASRFSCYIKLV